MDRMTNYDRQEQEDLSLEQLVERGRKLHSSAVFDMLAGLMKRLTLQNSRAAAKAGRDRPVLDAPLRAD